MGNPAKQRHPDARERERDSLEQLLAKLADSAHSGASLMVAGTAAAPHWTDLERAIARLMQSEDYPTSAVTTETLRLLTREDRSGQRRGAYDVMASDLQQRSELGLLTIPAKTVAHHIHHAVLWYSAWHLLAAGLPMPRVIRALQTGATTARPKPKRDPSQSWQGKLRAGRRAWQSVAKSGAWLAVQSAAHAKRGVAALQQARAERTAKANDLRAQQIERQKQAEADRAAAQAKVAAATARAASADAAPRTNTFQPHHLDGQRLRGSVVGTWLMLVVLSWVSLIWGALISLPFGIGAGVIASGMAGVVLVPLWGTIWGFLGMGNASESTLRQMEFKTADPNSPLAQTAAAFAERLGLPKPRVGTVPAFNAFAVGVNEKDATVAMGEPLIATLTPDETAAVIGHELGHIVSGDMRRMMLMRTFQNATVWFGVFQGLKQIARWLICWIAEFAILAFSRKREYWADAIGAALASKEAMIGALQKLEKAPDLTSAENTHARFMFRGRALATHPTTADRIRALQQETYIRRLPLKRS